MINFNLIKELVVSISPKNKTQGYYNNIIHSRLKYALDYIQMLDIKNLVILDSLQCESVLDLDDIYNGNKMPTISTLKRFCSIFGISTDWLFDGKQNIFYNLKKMPNIQTLIEYIEQTKPHTISFIRADEERSLAYIILHYENCKFLIVNNLCSISERYLEEKKQLFEFVSIILWLIKNQTRLNIFIRGILLEQNDFFDLLFGKKHFDILTRYMDLGTNLSWWKCLVERNRWHNEIYEKIYGKNFIEAKLLIEKHNITMD